MPEPEAFGLYGLGLVGLAIAKRAPRSLGRLASKREPDSLVDATTTPLASIFGSGFLVIVPILAGAVGSWSVLAMIAVCGLAFAVGSVLRFNIRHAEPALARIALDILT